MLAALDGPLHALVHRDPEILAPLTARQGEVRSLPAFTAAEIARDHLRALPSEAAGAFRVASFEAADRRGKAELLRAAASAGATRLELDPDLQLRSRRVLSLATAIAYTESYKRATACL